MEEEIKAKVKSEQLGVDVSQPLPEPELEEQHPDEVPHDSIESAAKMEDTTALKTTPEVLSSPSPVSHIESSLKLRLSQTESSKALLKTRYCLLLGTRFQWFKNASDAAHSQKIQGEVRVIGVEPWDGKGLFGHYQNGFLIRGSSVKHMHYIHCSAPTPESKESWMAAVQAAIQEEQARSLKSGSGLHSGRDWAEVEAQSELQKRKTMKVGGATTAATVAGAFVGSLILPGVGTAAGAMIAGYWTNKKTKAKRDRQSRAAAVREEDYRHLADLDTQCFKCHVNFRVLKSREYCVSCCLPFCQPHCSKKMALPQLDEFQPVPVCDLCAQRQDFLSFIFVITNFVRKMDSYDGDVERIVAADVKSPLITIQRDELRRVFENESFDVLKCLSMLHQFTEEPEAFAITIAQMARFIECRPGNVEFYWSQMIGLVRTLMQTYGKDFSKIQLVLYAYIMRAIVWRNVHLRLKALWEFLAIYDDAIQSDDILLAHMALFMVLTMVPIKEFKKISVVSALWLRDVPDHQMEHMAGVFADMEVVLRSFEARMPSILFWNWLYANTKETIQSCRSEMLELEGNKKLISALTIFPEHKEGVLQRGSTSTAGEGTTARLNYKLGALAQRGMPAAHEAAASTTEEEQEVYLDLQFEGMAHFVKLLTDIPEKLRHLDRKRRRDTLPVELDELQAHLDGTLYLPICRGGDPVKKILCVIKSESRVFSTKSRAPTLIAFEVQCLDVPVCRTLYTQPTQEEALTSPVAADRPSSLTEGTAEGVEDPFHSDLLLSTMSESTSGEEQEESLDLEEFEDPTTESGKAHALKGLEADERLRRRSSSMRAEEEEEQAYLEGSWEEKVDKCRAQSSYSQLPGWGAQTVISKSFDDMRQEAFVLQMLELLHAIFLKSRSNLWLRPYKIVCTGPGTGFIETLLDAESLDSLKHHEKCLTLKALFEKRYGPEGSASFERARENFISSMAGYSVVCYLLQMKDRHNGNIMLDKEGHIIHIDFGFVLGMAPGGQVSVETAPFKLTVEMVELMGGLNSQGYQSFKTLFVKGFLAARGYVGKLLALVALTSLENSPYPCFRASSPSKVLKKLRSRFRLKLSGEALLQAVAKLADKSYDHWGTRQYDSFQQRSNNILP